MEGILALVAADAARLVATEGDRRVKVVVAVDPAVTSNDSSDETGIIIAGKGEDNRYYILADETIKDTPDRWLRRAVDCYYLYNADRIVVEINNGGDLVERLLRTIDDKVPYKKVHATSHCFACLASSS